MVPFPFFHGMVACWSAAALTAGGAVWFSAWGAQQGLSGNFGESVSRPAAARKIGATFGRDPLYRKEFLWFTRDRSALIQAILIPLTVASFQLFNLRGLLSDVQGAWNYLSGAAILFGTYFLWVLGPKSLASEGNALWIALTWPRGLESLLKAKAWLWSLISSCMVALVLCYAAYLFPASILKIVLVGVGWIFLRPEHGGKERHAGHSNLAIGRAGKNSCRPPLGGAAWHADVFPWSADAAMAPGGHRHCLLLYNCRRHVAELPGASAVPL